MSDSKPIWHQPGWVTAIAGLVTALLSIPERVSDYAISIAENERIMTEARAARQAQELELIRTTLSEQGEERIFLLRFLVSTGTDSKTITWAQGEIDRLDSISKLARDYEKLAVELENTERALTLAQESDDTKIRELEQIIVELSQQINSKTFELEKERSEAGLISLSDLTLDMPDSMRQVVQNTFSRTPTFARNVESYRINFSWEPSTPPKKIDSYYAKVAVAMGDENGELSQTLEKECKATESCSFTISGTIQPLSIEVEPSIKLEGLNIEPLYSTNKFRFNCEESQDAWLCAPELASSED